VTPTLRLADVLDRLQALPPDLPTPPVILAPVLVDGASRPVPPIEAPRPAAVLVLLVPGDAGEALVVLTERTDRGGPHGGEVSFPGGAVESEDANPVAAALREAAEEIGLDPEAAAVTVLGELEPVVVAVSGYRITPVVAAAGRRPSYRPAPAEVAAVFEAPLETFLPGAPIEIVEQTIGERRIRYGAYPVAGHRVWGATARILGQLGALVSGGAEDEGRP